VYSRLSLSPYFNFVVSMFHYVRDTGSVKSISGLAVSVDTCRRMSTKAGCVWTTFVVIPSSAGSFMRSRMCLLHGEQTVSYFLLQDCKKLTKGDRGGFKERENKGEGHTHEGTPLQEITRVGHRV
jgi:hypothetical protein